MRCATKSQRQLALSDDQEPGSFSSFLATNSRLNEEDIPSWASDLTNLVEKQRRTTGAALADLQTTKDKPHKLQRPTAPEVTPSKKKSCRKHSTFIALSKKS